MLPRASLATLARGGFAHNGRGPNEEISSVGAQGGRPGLDHQPVEAAAAREAHRLNDALPVTGVDLPGTQRIAGPVSEIAVTGRVGLDGAPAHQVLRAGGDDVPSAKYIH
jgi:hypothetical protein